MFFLFSWALIPAGMGFAIQAATEEKPIETYDLVIYGATPGGIGAAVQASRMGRKSVILEASGHLGGMTTGGLGATDFGNKDVIGGISKEFYQTLGRLYNKPEAWTFEPHKAMAVYRDWIKNPSITLLLNQPLDLKDGVHKRDGRILWIRTESGRRFGGPIFIDSSYEGDLLAGAGVSFHVGRESNDVYGETLNGIQLGSLKHQFTHAVDPHIKPGDAASGLLPGIDPTGPGTHGQGDRRVQAYNFRMCMTDDPANRVPFHKPEGYDEKDFELLFRNFEAGDRRVPLSIIMMPNRKTDTNNNFAVSTDYIGANYDWPLATHAQRREIFRRHLLYQQGLMWSLANHPRVPEVIRRDVGRWGMARDEFVESGHWSPQIYVREARRMIGEYVMTELDCRGKRAATDSVGMGAYNMDSHNVRRYVKDGHVVNEGDVQVRVDPYPISFRALLPRRAECVNLLSPVCISSSHIAYGSIRMEPVFMALGQSAATAACMAMDKKIDLHDLKYEELRVRLLADKQVLEYRRAGGGLAPDKLKTPGQVLDDDQAKLTGGWTSSRATAGFIGKGYLHDGNEAKGHKSAAFSFKASKAGVFDLRLSYTPHENRATSIPVAVEYGGKTVRLTINQRRKPNLPDGFVSIGRFEFAKDQSVSVTISNDKTDGHVIIDALQIVPVQ